MSEFGGLWKHANNPACTESVKVFVILKLDNIRKKKKKEEEEERKKERLRNFEVGQYTKEEEEEEQEQEEQEQEQEERKKERKNTNHSQP